MTVLLDGRLITETGDITVKKVDAIVNAANSTLLGGGGVDGAIHRAGGGEILAECRKIREKTFPDGLPTGEAVITTAGRLSASYVIHTVGPVWHGGGRNEDQLLHNAYYNSLALASKKGIKTIAFPAISTGVYRFPKDRAARIAYNAIKLFFLQHEIPQKVYLVFFSKGDENLFQSVGPS